jgi:hypothetical protein
MASAAAAGSQVGQKRSSSSCGSEEPSAKRSHGLPRYSLFPPELALPRYPKKKRASLCNPLSLRRPHLAPLRRPHFLVSSEEAALLRLAEADILRFAEAALPRFAEAALLRLAETRAKPVPGVFTYLFHSS